MTENERVELELYIDVINELIGDFYVVTSKYNIPLNNNDRVGSYYRKMLKYVEFLRRTTSYQDVVVAKKNIIAMRENLAKLEAYYDV